jgi:hypothetical protein
MQGGLPSRASGMSAKRTRRSAVAVCRDSPTTYCYKFPTKPRTSEKGNSVTDLFDVRQSPLKRVTPNQATRKHQREIHGEYPGMPARK